MAADRLEMGDETRRYLEDIYAEEYNEMRRIAYFQSGQNAHLVDPSQVAVEALVRAALKRKQFNGKTPAEFRGWLRKILVNEVMDALRRADCRRRAAPVSGSVDPLEQPASGRSPLEACEMKEAFSAMYGALEQLSATDREILALEYRSDLTQETCAELVGVTFAAYRKRLERAKAKLRGKLDRRP
jgi:RNA polymerase sigma-70 factor (ECF subfamily)